MLDKLEDNSAYSFDLEQYKVTIFVNRNKELAQRQAQINTAAVAQQQQLEQQHSMQMHNIRQEHQALRRAIEQTATAKIVIGVTVTGGPTGISVGVTNAAYAPARQRYVGDGTIFEHAFSTRDVTYVPTELLEYEQQRAFQDTRHLMDVSDRSTSFSSEIVFSNCTA